MTSNTSLIGRHEPRMGLAGRCILAGEGKGDVPPGAAGTQTE